MAETACGCLWVLADSVGLADIRFLTPVRHLVCAAMFPGLPLRVVGCIVPFLILPGASRLHSNTSSAPWLNS
jgi:hypothetical protein